MPKRESTHETQTIPGHPNAFTRNGRMLLSCVQAELVPSRTFEDACRILRDYIDYIRALPTEGEVCTVLCPKARERAPIIAMIHKQSSQQCLHLPNTIPFGDFSAENRFRSRPCTEPVVSPFKCLR